MQFGVRMNELAQMNNIYSDTIFPNQASLSAFINHSTGAESAQQRQEN
jgi:hypothetical protein